MSKSDKSYNSQVEVGEIESKLSTKHLKTCKQESNGIRFSLEINHSSNRMKDSLRGIRVGTGTPI